MPWKIAQLIAAVSILFLTSCSKSEPEAVSEPQPADEAAPAAEPMPETGAAKAGGGDPTVVDSGHYTTEFENEAVRIVRIAYGAGEESVMHYHPDSVAVFVTDHLVQMTLPDGSTEEISAEAGDAIFIPGGQHLPKNISDSAWELVLVEIKSRDSEATDTNGPDATVVDADHYTTEFENEAVRIVRIAYGAGEEWVMHYHPDSVAVFVTDHLVQMTLPDGSTEEISAEAGDAIFIPGGQHLPKNISDSAWELVLIESKQ
jgi:quercetin dioxygenase-like cupin family protein